jgi:hypothetical protein
MSAKFKFVIGSLLGALAVMLVVLVLASLNSSRAFAGTVGDDDEDMFQSARRASAGKTRGRVYPGARDEQGLEVQVSLPQPSRNPDGTASVPEDDDDPQVTAPETD